MIRLDLTYTDPLQNLAYDEALLETAEQAANVKQEHPELLRFWEPSTPIVVLGRSSPYSTEVNHPYCQQHQIPVIRRCSGGQSIVTGKGCLMYALLLSYKRNPQIRMLDVAHQFVMQRMQKALKSIGIETQMEGTCDLTYQGKKFSGNSLRCKRNWVLYHGTMICDLSITLIASCLGKPKRQPDYRQQRSHFDFLCQLPTDVNTVKEAIAHQWQSEPHPYHEPKKLMDQLIEAKYRTSKWNKLN